MRRLVRNLIVVLAAIGAAWAQDVKNPPFGYNPATGDPWFLLSNPLYGVKGNTQPAFTVQDAAGASGQATLTSPGGNFANAVQGMTVVLDDSVEPALTSAATVNQGTCTGSTVCIPATPTTVATGGAGLMGNASFPVVTYFQVGCRNGGTLGRLSRIYVQPLQKATTNQITYKSPVATGGNPTCPNGGTQYDIYASIDTVTNNTVFAPGLAASQTKFCATTAMGTDLVINSIAASCTGALASANVVPSQKTTILTKNSNTSVTLVANLTATVAGAYAVVGWDDTAAVQAWLNALANQVGGVNQGSTGYCPTGEYLIASGPVTTMATGQLYIQIQGAGKTGAVTISANPGVQRGGSCEFINGSPTADMFQVGSSGSANNTGGMFAHVSFRDGIPGLMQATAFPVHCQGCNRTLWDDDSWVGFEQTYGIGLDSISSARYTQFNTFRDLNMQDVGGCIRHFNGLTSDNRFLHGTFYGSQTGPSRCFSFEANSVAGAGGNDFFEYPSVQFFAIHGYFFDRHGEVLQIKGENTSNPAGANPIGSSNTGTGIVLDGTVNSGGTYTAFANQLRGAVFAQMQRVAAIDSSFTGANVQQTIVAENSKGSNQNGVLDAGNIDDYLDPGMQVTTGATPGSFSTAAAATASAQQLLCVQLGQSFFNSFSQGAVLYAAGTYNMANSLGLTFRFNVSSNPNCTTSPVTLASIATATNPTTASTNNWELSVACATTAGDAAGTLICHGKPGLTIALTNNTTAATTYTDTNTAVTSAINLAGNLYLSVSVQKSGAGTTSDTFTNHLLFAK